MCFYLLSFTVAPEIVKNEIIGLLDYHAGNIIPKSLSRMTIDENMKKKLNVQNVHQYKGKQTHAKLIANILNEN